MLKFDRNGTPSTVVSFAKFHCALFFLFVHFNWIQDLDLLLKILLQNRHKICFHAIPLCTFWLNKEAASIKSIYNFFTTLIRGNRHKSLLGGKVWVCERGASEIRLHQSFVLQICSLYVSKMLFENSLAPILFISN